MNMLNSSGSYDVLWPTLSPSTLMITYSVYSRTGDGSSSITLNTPNSISPFMLCYGPKSIPQYWTEPFYDSTATQSNLYFAENYLQQGFKMLLEEGKNEVNIQFNTSTIGWFAVEVTYSNSFKISIQANNSSKIVSLLNKTGTTYIYYIWGTKFYS